MSGNATAMEAAAAARSRTVIGRRALLSAAAGLVLLSALPARAATDRRLALYNPHTDDRFDDVYWCDGNYVDESLRQIDWLMRDFHRDQVAPIDRELLDLLRRLADKLETSRPFHILSGFRTAATNRLLRTEGFGAAAHSEHLLAKAADIRIEHVRLSHLRRAAVSLKGGGVGSYPSEQFIHVDVGPVRTW